MWGSHATRQASSFTSLPRKASGSRVLPSQPRPLQASAHMGPRLPPGTASSLVGRAPHSQLLLPPSASHSSRQLDGLSRFHSISTYPARPMPSPQGWSVLCPNFLSALCHMAWYQSIVTSPFLWFHVCVSCFQREQPHSNEDLWWVFMGHLDFESELRACLVDEFVFCFPYPGLWLSTVPFIILSANKLLQREDLQPEA